MPRADARAAAALVLLCGCRSYVVHRNPDGGVGTGPGLPVAPPVSATVAAEAPTTSDLMWYTTKPGDTLAGIAREHLGWAALWRQLKEWNKLEHGPDDPLPGELRIVIPLRFRGLAGDRAPALTSTALEPVERPVPPPRPRITAFKPGEKLTFDVRWFLITAGQATLSVLPDEVWNGERCTHIVARAMSKLVFFFKVDDRIESVSTGDELLPVRFEKHLKEGKYRKDLLTTFDRPAHVATSVSKSGRVTAPLDDACRDILGSFYYFRTMELPAPGKRGTVCVHADKKNWQMTVEVLRRERVKVPAGEFDTVLVKPRLQFEGLFRQESDVLIWLTDDASRVPVLVQSKVALLGSVNIVLTKLDRP